MTSKEALESIKQCCYEYLQEFQNIEQVKFTGNCFMQLEQDLERSEVLEKENQYLKTTNEALNKMLLQASDEAIKVEQENEKLKKAIEVFKRLYGVNGEMYNYYNGGYICINNGVDITQQECELLKEVLGE